MENNISNLLTFLERANILKKIRRYKSSLSKNGDTVAEHSWRLTLMVFVIGTELKVPIDICRAMQLALIHDLAELKTDDIDAIEVITKKVSLRKKRESEILAMREILQDISFGQSLHMLWNEYEEQKTLEAKFVRALDKIEAFLHLKESGFKHYTLSEFYGNYADEAIDVFDTALNSRRPLFSLLETIKSDMKKICLQLGIKWKN